MFRVSQCSLPSKPCIIIGNWPVQNYALQVTKNSTPHCRLLKFLFTMSLDAGQLSEEKEDCPVWSDGCDHMVRRENKISYLILS